ncbi:excalibur calcium-binding domain-containing protein [Aurantiacibacter arachoides]|nr:excalibur calcium-binding domain-containing protein [Aurantiacibacter arachoides]
MFSARDEPPPEYRLIGEFERTATAADVADTDPQPATLYQAPELQPEPEPWPEPEPVYIAPAPVTAAYFRNCSDARAQGAAPVRSGDPGYSSKLDRDGDGVGCE